MSDQTPPETDDPAAGAVAASAMQREPDVTDPAKLIRLGTMLQAIAVELRDTENDQAGLTRLAQIHTETVEELQTILSEDLRNELAEFNDCCGNENPSESELRVAHAQLVGWIQGLLRGMQATATAQAQMMQQQMMMMQAQAQQQAMGAQGARPGGGAIPAASRPKPPNEPTGPEAGYL